jgi:uncharacterized protein (TIGR03083 family)
MVIPEYTDSLRWCEAGARWFDAELAALDAAEFAAPSLLPGWDRAHVAAHVINNAKALGNLVQWASSGEPTPMYDSMEQRAADIEAIAALTPTLLVDMAEASSAALAAAMANLSEQELQAVVSTMHVDDLPATAIAWLRARELMIHTHDLGTGAQFDEMPADFLMALIEDVAAARSGRDGQPALLLRVSQEDRYRGESQVSEFVVAGEGEPIALAGSAADVAAYLTGRNIDFGPVLSPWL